MAQSMLELATTSTREGFQTCEPAYHISIDTLETPPTGYGFDT